MNTIAKYMKEHYEAAFQKFGPTSSGVDWGSKEDQLFLRYDKMLAVITDDTAPNSVLDVGCGYGGLYPYAISKGEKITYTGIDIAKNMIEWARNNLTGVTLINDDFMEHEFPNNGMFDYVVCNGILTQKLECSNIDMEAFAKVLIKKMFSRARKGIAFNIMTTKVNYFANNLFYKNPSEILSWCIDEVSPKVVLDHSYLYEYTVYIYK